MEMDREEEGIDRQMRLSEAGKHRKAPGKGLIPRGKNDKG